eukprot:PhM_4_TR14872/c0_g1_i2/m.30115/K17408/DAP3, MRPS29; small subunit ribosomal protein S29
MVLRRTRALHCVGQRSVTKTGNTILRVQPFEFFDPESKSMRPPKTYTESCQGAEPMHKHLGKKLSQHELTKDGKAQKVLVEERLYDHPPEVPPQSLDFNSINRMYCMSNDDLRKYYPEGLGGKVMQLFVPGHPRGFLYRRNSHLLNVYIDKMKAMREDVVQTLRGNTAGLLLHGESGSGKSALLCQAVHYARAKGILTLYVPNASHYTHGEWAWPSVVLPGFFDVPDAARATLQYFARAHADKLAKMPLTVTPNDLPIDSTERPVKTLLDLCDWATRAQAPTSIDRQSIAIKFLLDELRNVKDVPVLYVVDGINLFALESHFRYPHPDYLRSFTSFEDANSDMDLYVKELPRIPSSRLTFVRGLNKTMLDIAKGDVAHQSVIAGTSVDFKDGKTSIAFQHCATLDPKFSSLDEYKPFHPEDDTLLHPMKVSDFDEHEYRSFFRFLVNSGELAGLGWGPLWHHSSDFERKLYKVDFLSGRNPQRVVDHYHQEFLWRMEYQRLRQKQDRGEEYVNRRVMNEKLHEAPAATPK